MRDYEAISYQFTTTFFTSHKPLQHTETRMHYTGCVCPAWAHTYCKLFKKFKYANIFWLWTDISKCFFFLRGESPLQAGWNLYPVYHNGLTFRDAYERYKPVSKPQGGLGWPMHWRKRDCKGRYWRTGTAYRGWLRWARQHNMPTLTTNNRNK